MILQKMIRDPNCNAYSLKTIMVFTSFKDGYTFAVALV